MFEHRPAVIAENLGRTCSAAWMRVHKTLQFPEPAVRNLYIRIEQQIVVKLRPGAFNLRKGPVVTSRKAVVAVKADKSNLPVRPRLPEPFHRPVPNQVFL